MSWSFSKDEHRVAIKCDHCGKVYTTKVFTGNPTSAAVPIGWHELRVMNTREEVPSSHLCPDCAAKILCS